MQGYSFFSVIILGLWRPSVRTDPNPRVVVTKKKRGVSSCSQTRTAPVGSTGQRLGAHTATCLECDACGAWGRAYAVWPEREWRALGVHERSSGSHLYAPFVAPMRVTVGIELRAGVCVSGVYLLCFTNYMPVRCTGATNFCPRLWPESAHDLRFPTSVLWNLQI